MTIAASAAGFGAAQTALLLNPPITLAAGGNSSGASGPVGTPASDGGTPATASSDTSSTTASSGSPKSTDSKPRLVKTEMPTTIAIGQIGTATFAAVVQRATNQVLYTIPPGYLTDLANAGYLSHTGYDLRT